MIVLHVLNSNQYSGAENVVCQIIEMFLNVPDVQMVYCSRDGQIRQALMERNINFAPVYDLTPSELKRVIRETKPDVIHAHDMRASFITALSCGKIPLISHIHNNAFDSRGISVKSIAYILAAYKAKHIFWVSQSSFCGYFFSKLFTNKSSVLYNIIDIEKLYERMQSDEKNYDYDVVYVGRLSMPKNPERLIRVCAQLAERKADIRIALVGTGDMEAETKALRARMGLEKQIEMLGFQKNPLKILYDSKVMIMTSRWEGTPMCALEAMALGVPIVSTPTDGLKDLIDEGENGFLSDQDDILVEQILKVVGDDALRQRLSENALRKACRLNNVDEYRKEIYKHYE